MRAEPGKKDNSSKQVKELGAPPAATTISIASFNVQNAPHNAAFVNDSLGDHDIICLQEHCLYSFEKHKMDNLFPGWYHEAISVDEEDPLDHERRPRGYGGVVTMWKPSINPYVESTNFINSRILVTLFNFPGAPVCVINCYLPSGNKKEACTRFKEDMDRLVVLYETYSQSHSVLIIGDLNEDHFHRSSPKEKATLDLINRCQLMDLGEQIQDAPTYVNHDLGHKSHIDHALVKVANESTHWIPLDMISQDDIRNATNTSYHLPIWTSFTLLETTKPPPNKTNRPTYQKTFKWREMDATVFAAELDLCLGALPVQSLNSDAATEVMQGAIRTATFASTPYVERRLQSGQKRQKWGPEIANAVQESKLAHFLWQSAGQPGPDHHLWQERKSAKRAVRRTQRRNQAEKRNKLRLELSQASVNDQKLFYKLIKQQRGTDDSTNAILVDGQLITDNEGIRNGWGQYFQALSQDRDPSPEDQRLTRYMRILARLEEPPPPVTTQDLDRAINGLKRGKAPDIYNLVGEQLKAMGPGAKETLTGIINQIIRKGKVPDILKQAYKLPIPKKGKDHKKMDNYRGITISAILCKILESVCLSCGIDLSISSTTNPLQCGFSKGKSPAMASLMITEAAAAAKVSRVPLYVASLDARKAFDVVNHTLLKKKLFYTNTSKGLWRVIDDMYVDSCEVIRWKGADSEQYIVEKGVKQGSISSPSLYKLYINGLLQLLKRSTLGTCIGSIYLGAPTCADDVLLMANSPSELQGMLNICHDYALQHRYELHPQKSVITQLVPGPYQSTNPGPWVLGNSEVTIAQSFVHLGLEWLEGQSVPKIDPLINSARRAAYALLGVGLHGVDGMDPPTAHKTITLFVLPRLIYGLEATILTKDRITQLGIFYKGLLRQVQNLPENVASEAVYILLGALPVEAYIDMKILSLVGAIARLDWEHPLRQIGIRQLATGTLAKQSWFVYAAETGLKYSIDVPNQLQHPWPKLTWKAHYKSTVQSFWENIIYTEAPRKKTLSWLIPQERGKCHPLWLSCRGNPFHINAASTRARMLTGRFRVQATISKFSKGDISPTCCLCGLETEDIEHMVARCPSLAEVRSEKIKELCSMYIEEGLQPPTSTTELTSAILNGAAYRRDDKKQPNNIHEIGSTQLGDTEVNVHIKLRENVARANIATSKLCLQLQTQRDHAMNQELIL